MEEYIQLHVHLVRRVKNIPLKGDDYQVCFYDDDLLSDDLLGESDLDDLGHAFVSVSRKDYRSKDSPFEKYPDVYFTVKKKGAVIFKSPVIKNLKIEEAADFPVSQGLHCDLGTFLI